MEEEDSDAEEMARIKADQKVQEYSSSEDEDDGAEEGEEEDEEMQSESSSSEEEGDKKPVSGKNALKKQLQKEKEIRDKEAQMRRAEGATP